MEYTHRGRSCGVWPHIELCCACARHKLADRRLPIRNSVSSSGKDLRWWCVTAHRTLLGHVLGTDWQLPIINLVSSSGKGWTWQRVVVGGGAWNVGSKDGNTCTTCMGASQAGLSKRGSIKRIGRLWWGVAEWAIFMVVRRGAWGWLWRWFWQRWTSLLQIYWLALLRTKVIGRLCRGRVSIDGAWRCA